MFWAFPSAVKLFGTHVFFFGSRFGDRDGVSGRDGSADEDENPGLSQTSIPNATPYRVATFTLTTTPFHNMPNATPIGLLPTGTFVRRNGVSKTLADTSQYKDRGQPRFFAGSNWSIEEETQHLRAPRELVGKSSTSSDFRSSSVAGKSESEAILFLTPAMTRCEAGMCSDACKKSA